MKSRLNFTKTNIDALPILKTQKDYWDTNVSGLQVRVYSTGRKTYFLYRKVKGRPLRIKIGRYADLSIDQARKEAGRLNSAIALGRDPAQERDDERAEITFKGLFERYYHDYAIQHNKRPEDNKKALELHILPVFGSLKLRDITAEKIRKLHLKIGEDSGKTTANRVMAMTNAVFNFGIKQAYHKLANPCYGLTKFRQYSRDRFLSKDELKKFFDALKFEKQLYQDYFSLLLYTGARKSNVLAMKWADIDFNLNRWRINEEETKNRDVNVVCLSSLSIEILKRRKDKNDQLARPDLYVFPGDGKKGHLHDPKKAFHRVRDRMAVQDICIHDLRRTLASYMAISGSSLPVIGAALNHKSQASTAIYARLAQAPVLEAVNLATEIMKTTSDVFNL